MAEKYWDHLKLKNGDKVHFVPPAPDASHLGGISAAEKNKITQLQSDIATLTKDDVTQRVTGIDGSTLSSGATIECVGIPVYVDSTTMSQYSSYGITQSGWYSFAKITPPKGVSITSAKSVTGANAKWSSNYVSVAVLFGVTGESKKVTVKWGSVQETFVFKATDLAVRNLDYKTTFYIYNIEAYATVTDESITFEGMTTNITYEYKTVVDRPVIIKLPEVTADSHGVWLEIRMRFDASHSVTIEPPDDDVLIRNTATPITNAGYVDISFQYYNIDGMKLWRIVNNAAIVNA